MKQVKLMQGDNIESLKKLPDNSIDSVVSDPPYGLSFMGKKWDYDVPSVDFWKEVYRVLKPGGHVLSFGGTRTYHRMVVNIEDAGFEIRDQIQWLYGSGFPKSLNIGKVVDKLEGNEREDLGRNPAARPCSDTGNYETNTKWKTPPRPNITKGTSSYEGWGTALKPANEPICVARKPLSEKTIAENVIKWKTGGINIDGCRVETDDSITFNSFDSVSDSGWKGVNRNPYEQHSEGRFPANLILDEEAAQMLDEQSGISGTKSIIKKTTRERKYEAGDGKFGITKEKSVEGIDNYGDKGGASRFFYIAKVSKKERNMGLDGFEDKKSKTNQINSENWLHCEAPVKKEIFHKNNHPTVKPINLMAYLCRLITPENGIVLDPFMGSGSTGVAALLEGFRFCGMEMDKDYFKIAESRIENYEKYREFLDKKNKKSAK